MTWSIDFDFLAQLFLYNDTFSLGNPVYRHAFHVCTGVKWKLKLCSRRGEKHEEAEGAIGIKCCVRHKYEKLGTAENGG